MDLNRFTEAEAQFREALRLEPSAMHHYNLGAALANQARFTEAEPEYREAIRLDPTDKRFETGLQQLLKSMKANGQASRQSAKRPARDSQTNNAANGSATDPRAFDLSGIPKPPTNFEEQQLLEYARENGTSWSQHEKLAQYYEKKGDMLRAKAEHEKAKYWREH